MELELLVKQYQKEYNKKYYQEHKDQILKRVKANQNSEDWKSKRKDYRKKYYELNGK